MPRVQAKEGTRLPGCRSGLPLPVGHAGVDEVGRGCLAGPVVGCAVILSEDIPGLADSKALSARRRLELEPVIKSQAVAWAMGVAWPTEIETKNILRASLSAMARAVLLLKSEPSIVLVDGNQPLPIHLPQRTVVGGDALVPAISAASILAKTFRDRLLEHLDRRYPGYGLARHKGYATQEHRQALVHLGPSPMHRLSFRGVLPDQEPGQEADQLWLLPST